MNVTLNLDDRHDEPDVPRIFPQCLMATPPDRLRVVERFIDTVCSIPETFRLLVTVCVS